jgi:DNA-binding transcriptional LysR family regulator
MNVISKYNDVMTRNLDISVVRTFVAVADHGSMTVAANSLHLTQSAVSQQIKRLEQMFGCDLFERDGRRLELTHDGERFLRIGSGAGPAVQEFAQHVRDAVSRRP